MSDGIVPLTPQEFAAEKERAATEGYAERNLVALDDAANALFGGKNDETISSRLARDAEEHKLIGEVGSKLLDVLQPDHGADAQAGDTERAEAVLAEEEKFDGNQK